MVDVLTSIQINRPVSVVAAYAADPDHATEWYQNITSVNWVTSKPLQLGSKLAFKAQFLGRQMEYTYEVVEYDPGSKLVMRTAEGPFPMETIYTWKAVESGKTLMTLRNAGQPSGFSRLFKPVMEMMMRRANRKDLALIKQILEQR
ncbi:SRPBCC family protein [Flavilitoribacter nigricans]|uniref:ATPase n=1 Tax=Flavilitoribacter nigricans (strain ATCC 23147 / DSM 23189 / NBRC 102662 / NCIMB 1420 / SS-2) TaxID=1122177 RepID=A0A2D0NCG4_FLAN2|nr:SRPBCC family protein [Flavilitoribacter nigricans]PHN06070.1 ATPase [Flavilitoribacter nigricans DSM 23189 = NBRC 102662]